MALVRLGLLDHRAALFVLLWGFILHALLYAAAGRWRDVKPALRVLTLVSVGLLLIEVWSLRGAA